MALKIRKNQSPAVPHDCPLTECMSIIGGAWTVNIIWALCAGPRRFNELRVDIPAVSAKVLTTRLKELCERQLVERKVKDTSPPSVEYSLTEFGRELIPAIEGILEVGHKLKGG
jgi:DNA-binding HxlR family transcriptional regulator